MRLARALLLPAILAAILAIGPMPAMAQHMGGFHGGGGGGFRGGFGGGFHGGFGGGFHGGFGGGFRGGFHRGFGRFGFGYPWFYGYPYYGYAGFYPAYYAPPPPPPVYSYPAVYYAPHPVRRHYHRVVHRRSCTCIS